LRLCRRRRGKKLKRAVVDEEIDLSNISEEEYIEMLNKDIEDNMEMFNDERKLAAANKKITAKMNKKLKKEERRKEAESKEIQTVKNREGV